ncbi:MAG TPA: dienelactone hydrolase family protein [Bacteroidia bacterium]|nr:dienelactone hydrolase family protein [Bacteroidia bacterium]
MLGKDPQFARAHDEPDYFVLPDPKGVELFFPCQDGKQGHAYELKSPEPSTRYLILIHEWWGLNDYIRKEAERLQSQLGSVNVIAIDLYDLKQSANRDTAALYMQSVKPERAEAIIQGAIRYVGPDAELSSLGWCFGGGWSLQTALLAGKQSRSCVMYYGAPEENTEKLKSLNCPVFFVWPEQDKWINKEVVDKFKSNMNTCKKSLEIVSYNADHAFANPSNPKFNKAFAEDASVKAIKFIQHNWSHAKH